MRLKSDVQFLEKRIPFPQGKSFLITGYFNNRKIQNDFSLRIEDPRKKEVNYDETFSPVAKKYNEKILYIRGQENL